MWDIVVGISTGYGLEGPGIESQLVARFSAPVQTDGGTPSVLQYNGHGIDHTSSTEVKERV